MMTRLCVHDAMHTLLLKETHRVSMEVAGYCTATLIPKRTDDAPPYLVSSMPASTTDLEACINQARSRDLARSLPSQVACHPLR